MRVVRRIGVRLLWLPIVFDGYASACSRLNQRQSELSALPPNTESYAVSSLHPAPAVVHFYYRLSEVVAGYSKLLRKDQE